MENLFETQTFQQKKSRIKILNNSSSDRALLLHRGYTSLHFVYNVQLVPRVDFYSLLAKLSENEPTMQHKSSI